MNRIAAIVVKEVREVVPAFLFFLVLFHLVALTKAVSLGDFSSAALRAVFATVAALIVAKAVLLVEKLPIPAYFASRLVLQVLWKTLLFGALAILFHLLEEFVPRIVKHESLAGAVGAMYRETYWAQFGVVSLWLFAGLLVYTLAVELVRIVGADRVKEIVFGRRDGIPR